MALSQQEIDTGLSLAKSIFGGGTTATSCPNQDAPEKVQLIVNAMNDQELGQLWTYFQATKPNWLPASAAGLRNPALFITIAFAIAGGGDCQVTSGAGKTLVAYWTQMRDKYYGMLGKTVANPGGTAYVPQTAAEPSNLDKLRAALGGILGSVEDIVTNSARAGLSGVQASTNAAATASKQVATGTSVLGQVGGMGVVLVVGIAALALIFAFRK